MNVYPVRSLDETISYRFTVLKPGRHSPIDSRETYSPYTKWIKKKNCKDKKEPCMRHILFIRLELMRNSSGCELCPRDIAWGGELRKLSMQFDRVSEHSFVSTFIASLSEDGKQLLRPVFISGFNECRPTVGRNHGDIEGSSGSTRFSSQQPLVRYSNRWKHHQKQTGEVTF